MKTKEFIKKLKEIGFETEILECGGRYLEVYDDCSKVAEIDIQHFLSISTNYSSFDNLSEEKKQPLFSFLMEYAMTPIEERQEEKKYMYRLKKIDGIEYIEDYRYLNYDTEYNSWAIGDKTGAKIITDTEEVFEVKYIFTHSWLEERGVDIEQLKEVYEEIEVKGDK